MTLPRYIPKGLGQEPDYGTPAQRLKFVRYLRDHLRFSLEDISERSLYSVDSVKAWLSESDKRSRDCPKRAVALMLKNLRLTEADYWTIVSADPV